MSKEAIVFILDANVTMNAPYPPHTPPTPSTAGNDDVVPPSSSPSSNAAATRLSHAKDAILDIIVDRMWKSKQNEVGIIVLKAGTTHHHLHAMNDDDDDDDDVDIDEYLGRFFSNRREGYDGANSKGRADSATDVPFPNIVEFDLDRPSPRRLRSIRTVTCTMDDAMGGPSSSVVVRRGGDMCDGLILAADSLHRRTSGKKYRRRIVMITDAEHEVNVNGEQLMHVLGELNKMEVEFTVLGIGFDDLSRSVHIKDEDGSDCREHDHDEEDRNNLHEDLGAVPSMDHGKPDAVVSMMDRDDDGRILIKEEGNPDEMIDDDASNRENDERAHIQFIKRENEKFLCSIAIEIGGDCRILAANGADMTGILRGRIPCVSGQTNSIGKKIDFRISPDLTILVKMAKLTSRQNLPTTIKEAYQFDPRTGEKLRDGNGELMTLPTRTQTNHYDDDGNLVPYGERGCFFPCNDYFLPVCIHSCVSPNLSLRLSPSHRLQRTNAHKQDKRTDAYRYGSDLIPVGKMDMLGINAAFADPGSIEMIGYIDRVAVESSNLLMGPAYAITGGESKKSRIAIAALSRALDETGTVGYCRVVRTKNGEPKIGALVPRLVVGPNGDGGNAGVVGQENKTHEEGGEGRYYLAFLELPFADDLQRTIDRRAPLEYHGDCDDERACDDLIDSMMLPDDEFRSEDISNPALASYRRMVAALAMDPISAIEETQTIGMSEGRILGACRARPLRDYDVVKSLHEGASRHINAFLDAFPLVEHKPEDDKKRKFWGDGNNR
jgi:ATP-dependent DNA helicase 2 subunit 2